MATVLFFVFFGLVCKAIKAGLKADRTKANRKPTATAASALSAKLAALEALQAQRDELNEQLDIINGALDGAPPEAQRMKWMKERSRVYGQLATVENKIYKLIH